MVNDEVIMAEGMVEGQNETAVGAPVTSGQVEITCRDRRSFRFDPGTTALLVIDMQTDFIGPDGYIASLSDGQSPLAGIIPALSRTLEAARGVGLTIVHTREGYAEDGADVNAYKKSLGYVGRPGPGGPFLVRGSAGHDFSPAFCPLDGELVIDKAGFSAFYGTDLESRLKDEFITHLILTGVTTQCCVHSTLRDAVERGYFCLTLQDCCAAEDPVVHEATLRIIQAENHLFGWVAESDAFLCGVGAGE